MSQPPMEVKLIESKYPVQKVKRIGKGAYGIVNEVNGENNESHALKRNFVEVNTNF